MKYGSIIVIYLLGKNMKSLHIFTVLMVIVAVIQAQGWNRYTDIRTDRIAMINTTFSSSTVPISYNLTYSSSISSATSAGLGIVGFNTLLTDDFSVNTTIYGFTNTYIHIVAQALDTTLITYLAVNYIAVGGQTYFLDVQFYCFLPSTISVGNGTRSQTRTSTSIYNEATLTCNVYLSGFRNHNTNGLVNYLTADISCPSSALTTTFTVQQNNTVSQICYTTLVFCQICTNITYYQWGQTGLDVLSNTVTGSSLIVLARYTSMDKMFWGMSGFNVSRGHSLRDFNLQTDNYNSLNTNYSSNPGTYAINMAHFFIATRSCNGTNNQWFQILPNTVSCVNNNNCDNSTVQTLGTSARYCKACHYTCKQCSNGALAENCSSCQSLHFRTLQSASNTCPCDPGYIDIGISLCYTCNYYIAGCNTCTSTTTCTLCLTGYSLTAANICTCNTGFLVTGVCTTQKACILASNFSGTVFCQQCNSTINFVVASNFSCVCTTAHYLDANGDCVGQCGDQLLATDQTCDDGNTVDGDGCSSSCQVETYYFCNNAAMPSHCRYNTNVTATVRWVQRNLDSNTVQFGLQILPFFNDYYTMSFTTNITTTMPCSKHNTYMQDNYLVYECTYTRSIEGDTYPITFQMDNGYFTSTSFISASLPATGMNAKLTYDEHTGLYQFQKGLIIGLVCLAFIVLFASLITQRMIGVELIQTFQLVYFCMVVMAVSPATIAPLHNLTYSNGFNGIKSNSKDRRYPTSRDVAQIGLQHQFLENFNLMYLLLGLVIVILIVLKGILLKIQVNHAEEQKQFNRNLQISTIHTSYPTIKKTYRFIFQRVFFVLGFLCMFLILFSLSNQLMGQNPLYYVLPSSANVFLAIIAAIILIAFLLTVVFNGLYPGLSIFPMFMHKKYPIYYTFYNLAFITILIGFHASTGILYVLAVMVIANTIVLAIWRPYNTKLHNITILVEQGVVLLALGVYGLSTRTDQKDNNQTIFLIAFFVIAALLLTIVILSFIRLYQFYKYMQRNKISYDGEENQFDKDEGKALMTPKTRTARNENHDIGDEMGNRGTEKVNQNGNYGRGNAYSHKAKDARGQGEGLDGHPNNSKNKFQQDYYDSLNNNKTPISTVNQGNQGEQTRRRPKNNNASRQQNKVPKNEVDNYQTFNRNKGLTRTSKVIVDPIEPLQPTPDKPSFINGSPYDQYGNIRNSNLPIEEQDQTDRLKIIKARLRKDFHQKIRGTNNQASRVDISVEPSMNQTKNRFDPGDLADD